MSNSKISLSLCLSLSPPPSLSLSRYVHIYTKHVSSDTQIFERRVSRAVPALHKPCWRLCVGAAVHQHLSLMLQQTRLMFLAMKAIGSNTLSNGTNAAAEALSARSWSTVSPETFVNRCKMARPRSMELCAAIEMFPVCPLELRAGSDSVSNPGCIQYSFSTRNVSPP